MAAEQEEVDTRNLGLDDGDDSNDDEEEEEDILDMEDDDVNTTNNQREALLMRFCPHDSSMLYPQVRLREWSLFSFMRLCSVVRFRPRIFLIFAIHPPLWLVSYDTTISFVWYHTLELELQEDKQSRSLQYACRLCRYTEPAGDQPLIYRNDLKKEAGNILHTVPSAISDDPTLARSQNTTCANCNHNEAVFFQSDIAQADSLALIFVCCNCDHKWVNWSCSKSPMTIGRKQTSKPSTSEQWWWRRNLSRHVHMFLYIMHLMHLTS